MTKLTHARLKELLSYDPQTGVFTRRVRAAAAHAGTRAGSLRKCDGYWKLCIDDGHYLAHRVAWFYVHGVWPAHTIDHVNGNRLDNRLCNLREATRAENNRNLPRRANNTSGFKGVSKQTNNDTWMAYINVDGRHIHLGTYSTKEQAHAAYRAGSQKYHGSFGRVA